MKPLHVNLLVAVAAALVGAACSPWIAGTRAQPIGAPPASTAAFVMPASMPGVTEPAYITAQRAALVALAESGAVPVRSGVISVGKLQARSSGVGTRRDLFNGPTVTLSTMEGHISTLNPGELSHPPHQHLNEELIIVMEGALEVTINGKTSVAEKGDVMFFASEDWHNVRNAGNSAAMYYVLNWSAAPKPVPTNVVATSSAPASSPAIH